jgi:homogentisate phytyltransferase/homogentisate geranylgeranyltransferase
MGQPSAIPTAVPPLRAAWSFVRPHTIIGTTLAVAMFYTLAVAATGHHDFRSLLVTYLAGLAVNVYIVGLNQITDVAIDKINKPYLPLAAGAMTRTAAQIAVGVSALLAVSLAALQGRYLLLAISLIFLIGTAYSLPPFRLKRFPCWAAAAITIARALVFNIGLYVSFSVALGGTPTLPAHVAMFVAFMFCFVVVIALMKDVPDVDGDREHGIATLVLRLGAARTLLLCKVILTVAYLGVIGAALVGISGLDRRALAALHLVALGALWARGARVDATRGEEVYRYYMFVWKLFYFEFLAFAVACLIE